MLERFKGGLVIEVMMSEDFLSAAVENDLGIYRPIKDIEFPIVSSRSASVS